MSVRRHVLLGFAALAAGCGGAAEAPRAAAVPAQVASTPAPSPALPATEPAPPPGPRAWARIASAAGDLPGGPAATGRAGDLVLGNEHLLAVVGAASGGAPGRAGALLDVAPAGGADALGEMVPVFDEAGRRLARIDAVTVTQDGARGGPAVVRASGIDRLDEQLGVEIEYVLDPGARHLRLRTTVTHRGRSHYRDFVLGRLLVWGGLEPLVPGASGALTGQRARSDWVGADAEGASLAFAPVGSRVESIHARSWSIVVERRDWLRPGSVLTREAHLFVDAGGGVASASAALQGARGTVTGGAGGRLVELGGAPITDGRVTFFDATGAPAERARTDAEGRFAARLAPGSYRAVAEAPGRPPGPPLGLRIGADTEQKLDLRLERRSWLRAAFTDEGGRPLAARLVLEGGGGSRVLLVPAGGGSWPVAPGAWRVRATAGPDRARAEQRVRVPPSGEVRVDAALPRQVDRTGFLSVDAHVRTRASGTSATTLAARLTACATEGVDAVVVADDGVVDPALAAVEGGVRAWPGLALEATGGGRFAAFPIGQTPADAPDLGPEALLGRLRAWPGRPLIAVLRPREGETGYFAAWRYEGRAATLPRGGFSLDFDILQVGVPWPRAEGERALADYFALLDAGRDVVPVGGSGADALADPPCGLPRTLVRGSAGAGPEVLRTGDVVVSHGPVIDLEVDGIRPGGRVPARSTHDVRVRVRSSDWRRPTTLDIVIDGDIWRRLAIPPAPKALDVEHRLLVPAGARWLLARVDGPEADDGVAPSAFTHALRFEPPAGP